MKLACPSCLSKLYAEAMFRPLMSIEPTDSVEVADRDEEVKSLKLTDSSSRCEIKQCDQELNLI